MYICIIFTKGKEPSFTNFAWSSFNKEEPFVGTLDYVFVSDEWEVKAVKSLEESHATDSGFPSSLEPSDHVLIAADLELSK